MTHYFLGTRLLGVSPHLPWWSDSERTCTSQALLCPTCGEVWGRIAVAGLPWQAITRGCKLHPYLADIGGTFIAPWRRQFEELPPEVLRYEFDIRVNQLEKLE